MIGVGRILITALIVFLLSLPTTQAADFNLPVEGLDSPESVVALSSGFLAPDLPVDGTILEDSSDTQLIIGSQRTLFLRMTSFENLAPGDLFTVYRRIHQVFHPAHGQYLGWLIGIRGIVQVTKIDLDLKIVTVRVVRAFEAMTPGDAVMRYSPPMPQEEPSPARTPPDKQAIVVELSARQTLVGQRNVLYFDWGKEEGLVRGDHFDVFRPKLGRPLRWVGEVRVLSMQAHTGTGMIVRSPVNIVKGDLLVLKDTKAAAQVEEDLKPLERDVQGLEVKREGDKVTITLIDQVLFDSGQAEIKPEGRDVLQRVSEILRSAGEDQLIRVEGHTDNVRIGPSLKKVYPSNWELSRARANTVRTYLSAQGGINPDRLSSAEYADTRPIATNATEEGRQKNRRVEIILMPKEQDGGAALPTGLVR